MSECTPDLSPLTEPDLSRGNPVGVANHINRKCRISHSDISLAYDVLKSDLIARSYPNWRPFLQAAALPLRGFEAVVEKPDTQISIAGLLMLSGTLRSAVIIFRL